MGDRTWTITWIGGVIPSSLRPDLLIAINDDCLTDNETEEQPTEIVAGPALVLYGQEMNYGEARIADLCLKHGIPHTHEWGEGGGYEGGFYVFDGTTRTGFGGRHGEAMIGVETLRGMTSIQQVHALIAIADWSPPAIEIDPTK